MAKYPVRIPSSIPLAVARCSQPLDDFGDEIAARHRTGVDRVPDPVGLHRRLDHLGQVAAARRRPPLGADLGPNLRAVSSSRARASPSSLDKASASEGSGAPSPSPPGRGHRGSAIPSSFAPRPGEFGDACIKPALRALSSKHRNHRVPYLRVTGTRWLRCLDSARRAGLMHAWPLTGRGAKLDGIAEPRRPQQVEKAGAPEAFRGGSLVERGWAGPRAGRANRELGVEIRPRQRALLRAAADLANMVEAAVQAYSSARDRRRCGGAPRSSPK